ncbi:MAG: hypothetical protein E7254_11505 [Lachnospiraceae bacterium]|nr:hypothetical protein [Lachnospiraceae bacterium]
MKLAVETFTTIIVVTISCILLSSMVSVAAQESDAREFFNVARCDIENSEYDNLVIENCINEAKSRGYKLEVEDVSVSEKKSTFMTMYYEVVLPIHKIVGVSSVSKGRIQGYAR